MTITSNPSSYTTITNPSPATAQTLKVNLVQSTSSKKPKGKNKSKGKSKKDYFEWGGEQTQKSTPKGNKNNKKIKYPCMLCKEDHLSKDYPHLSKVHQYLE